MVTEAEILTRLEDVEDSDFKRLVLRVVKTNREHRENVERIMVAGEAAIASCEAAIEMRRQFALNPPTLWQRIKGALK